jgi:hypothetical protein
MTAGVLGDVAMRWIRCAAWVVVLSAAGVSRAAGQGSDEGAPFLLLPVGADAVALGRAMTAMRGPESAFWNPAGLVSVERSQLTLLRGDGPAGTSTAASILIARPGFGTLGISYLLLDVGNQENTDFDDNLLGTISIRDHLAVVSGAAHILPGVDAGVNFKVLEFRRSCRGDCEDVGTSSTGYAVDAGLQFVPLHDVPLRLGAMVAHLGPRLQLENAAQADPLPTRIRVAAAYDVLRHLSRPGLEGWVTAELQDRPGYPGGPALYLGSELAAGEHDVLYLRAGLSAWTDQPGGASVGLGLESDRFRVSVAKALASSVLQGAYEPLTISFSVGF